MLDFGKNIKEIIERKCKTQIQVAKDMGKSSSCVNQWVHNKRDMTLKDIYRFCELYHTTPNELFGFGDTQKQEETIGDRMREVLKKRDFSNTQAAKMMGISQPRLALWLSGKNEPGQESIKLFCKLFDTTPNYLMGFEDRKCQS